MKEHDIQNGIRNALAGKCFLFRANVGSGWTGKEHQLPNGDMLLKNPRRFNTGLPKGFSDTFGFRLVEITPDMVGTKIAQFVAIEVKTTKGAIRDEQTKFIDVVNKNGGRGGICRSPEDALNLIEGK